MKGSILRLWILNAMVIVCYSCSPKDDQLVFKSVPTLNHIDSFILPMDSSKHYTRSDNFIVEGYSDNKLSNLNIDNYAFSEGSKWARQYKNYSIWFFKKSKETTVENITNNKHIVDRYSVPDDLLVIYYWSSYGKFLKKEIRKNGMPIDFKDDIKVEDVQ